MAAGLLLHGPCSAVFIALLLSRCSMGHVRNSHWLLAHCPCSWCSQSMIRADSCKRDTAAPCSHPAYCMTCESSACAGPLHSETVKLRTKLPPLLVNLADLQPPAMHYLGVSFGLTAGLLGFWQRCGFHPVYLRQTPSEVTGRLVSILCAASKTALCDEKLAHEHALRPLLSHASLTH